jgi:RNA polymerase sporulation-specific sigma factor
MYTAVQASGRKKHMPLNTYISIYSQTAESDGGQQERAGMPLESILIAGQRTNPEDMLIDQENVGFIEQVIQTQLSSFEKQVLDLYLTGMSYVEIARVLGKDAKSADNALHRIKSKIKRAMKAR